MIPFSILDLSPIVEGGDAAQALRNTIDLAQHAERWGYHRYWLAEHHNIPSVASAATSVVICAVAGQTSTIRVGAGGIMLPNHSPLVIAEQFGTLESLFPGRIDLALGRAPGSDQLTARALRRKPGDADTFPQDVLELITYFHEQVGPTGACDPGRGLEGSCLDSGIEPVRRSAGGRAGTAVRVRVAFRAGADDGRDRRVPEPISSVAVSRAAAPDAGRQRGDRRNRRGSEAAVHVSSAGIRESQTRHAWSAPASRSRIPRTDPGAGEDGKSIRPCQCRSLDRRDTCRRRLKSSSDARRPMS